MVKLATILLRAIAEYAADEADENLSFPYSPARATAALAKRYGYPASRLVGPIADVYYRENGTRAPLSIRAKRDGGYSDAAIASAVAKRRNDGGRLGRWEVIGYSLAETLGRTVPLSAVRAYARASGKVSETASYTGRGTRAGAIATRTDETAEVRAARG